MQSLGKILKTLMPNMTSGSEIDRYICEGCREEVLVMDMPILAGPDKGQIKRLRKGCMCWEYEQARAAKQELIEMRLKNMFDKNSIVSPDLQNASFDTYIPDNPVLIMAKSLALDYVDRFSMDSPSNLLFSGKYGLGKSHLSYAICKAVESKGHNAIFISVPKLLTKIRGTYNKRGDYNEAELLDALSTVDFLALDDIGAERVRKDEEGDSWSVEKLFEIIDGRNGRHTIYTTNLSSDELKRKVGERIFSRMMMNTKTFRFEGDDYRIKSKRF